MLGKIIKDWSKVDIGNPEHRRLVAGSLARFLGEPASPTFKAAVNAAVKEFTTAADFPASILPIMEKFNIQPYVDYGYEQIFDMKDYTGSDRNGFTIYDVDNGLTFALTPAGAKAKVFELSGLKSYVYFERFAGGLSWDRTLFDDKEYLALEDIAIAFRSKAYYTKAAAFYALIEALPATQDVLWQAATGFPVQANRDANTMNAAALRILTTCNAKGYNITPDNPLVVLNPLQIRGRIRQALALASPFLGISPNVKQIDYNFVQISTMMLVDTAHYYVFLPKNKLKGGTRMDLQLFSDFDILSYSDVQAGWMRFGGAIGDIDQGCRCNIA